MMVHETRHDTEYYDERFAYGMQDINVSGKLLDGRISDAVIIIGH